MFFTSPLVLQDHRGHNFGPPLYQAQSLAHGMLLINFLGYWMSEWLLGSSKCSSTSVSCHIFCFYQITYLSRPFPACPWRKSSASLACHQSQLHPPNYLYCYFLDTNMILLLWSLQWLPNFSRNKFQFLILVMTTWLNSPLLFYCLIHCVFQPWQESHLCALNTYIFFHFLCSLCCFELLILCLELEYWH